MKRRSVENLNAQASQKKHLSRKNTAGKASKENLVEIKRQWPSVEKMKDRNEKEKTNEQNYQRHQQAIQQRNKGLAQEKGYQRQPFGDIRPENQSPSRVPNSKTDSRRRQSKSMHHKAPPPTPIPVHKQEKKPESIPINPEKPADQAKNKYPAKLTKDQLNESQKIRIRNMKVTVQNSEKVKQDGTIPIKLVLVGDGSVGKTSMLISYTTDNFPTDYVPTVFDNYVADVKVGDNMVKLWLWDTAGQQEYEQLRLISYQKADVFFICFSMIDQNSFHNAINKWFPQVQEQCPKAMKIFVGTKYDLHQEYLEDAQTLHKAIPMQYIQKKCLQKKCAFMPCSGLNQKGLNQVFTKAIATIIDRVNKKKKEQSSLCQMI